MILCKELRNHELIISYYDSSGEVKIKKAPIREKKAWVICKETDRAKSSKFRNWDGKPVKQIDVRYLNKWGLAEFILNLPSEFRAELNELNIPRIVSLDIETEVIDGFPRPEIARERITAIALAESRKVTVLGWKELDRASYDWIHKELNSYLNKFGQFDFEYKQYNSETEMLNELVEVYIPKSPLITGWNLSEFDYPYIYNRCQRLGIDIANCSPTQIVDEKTKIPLHVGMLDYMQLYKKFDRSVAVKENNSLDFVAKAVLGVTKLKYDGSLQELFEKDYRRYILYNAIDAILVQLIHEKLQILNMALALTNRCELSIDQCFSPVAITEGLLVSGYYKRNLVVADRRDKEKLPYEGAYVKSPLKGIHGAVACFDYASLYPSVMRQFNISPESFILKSTNDEVLQKYKNNPDYIVCVNGSVYDNTKESVLKVIISELYAERKYNKNRQLAIDNLLAKLNK